MRKLLICCVMIFFILNTRGQNVGLVLSGGGAKGLAHIGVIKALEENNIPIDYITGTSMGAIIGGLYAIGMSPEEMQELVTSKQFENWATGKIEDKYLYYFKNEEINAAQFTLKLAKRDSTTVARLPTNIIPTHAMDFTFMEFFAPANAAARGNFDNLLVPFRCVASDIYNNKAVVLDSGDLGTAIRASMTFPFYFKPISIDSTLLFDGGMHNNFPFDVMMDCFDPDYIIGSKTADNSVRPDEENILSQIENMLLGKSNFDIPDDYGIMIETSLDGIGLLDMHKADSIINTGYMEANKNIERILHEVNKRKSNEDLERERENFKKSLPDLKFGNIRIEGVNNYQKTYIENCIRQNEMIFDLEDFREEYYKLLMDDKLSSIYPTAIYYPAENLYELNLKVKVETQFEIQLGGNISSSSNNQGYAGLTYKQLGEVGTKIHGNLYFGRLYNSFMLKTRLDYPTKIPFYLEGGITLNRWDYFHSNNEPFFEDYRPGYVIQNEGNIRINVGFPVKTNSTFITSTSISNEKDEYHQSINFSRGDTNDVSKYNMFNYQFKFEKNTLNYPLFPTKGHYMHVLSGGSVGEGIFLPGSFQSMDGKEVKNISWFNLNIKNEKYLYLTERFYLGSLLELNLSTKEFFNNYTGTIILANSFKPTLLSRTLFLQDYRAFNFLGIGMLPGYNFSDQWGLKCEGFLFMPYRKILPDENNRAYYGKPFHHYSLMGGISLVYQSPFGPASLSVNYFEKIGKNLFIQFNFGYILFNNRGNQ